MSKPNYEEKETDGVKEYFKDGEKIAFLNEHGTLAATHGNAGEKEALKEWIDAHAPHDHEKDKAPEVTPGTARFEFTKEDQPKAPKAKPTGPPAVPEKEPRLRPGFGIIAPDYVWWAYHQPDDVFQGIYKTSKAEWEKEHGGYLEKIRNRTVKGGLQ